MYKGGFLFGVAEFGDGVSSGWILSGGFMSGWGFVRVGFCPDLNNVEFTGNFLMLKSTVMIIVIERCLIRRTPGL